MATVEDVGAVVVVAEDGAAVVAAVVVELDAAGSTSTAQPVSATAVAMRSGEMRRSIRAA